MDLYEFLLKTSGYNEPIFTSEIKFKNYSTPWIFKELNKLCESGQIVHFDKGTYYIPKKTPLGMSLLSPRRVIEKKYITSGNNAIGYYSGVTFLNMLGLTTQMANTIEIYTNNETANVRNVTIGKQNVMLRKARTEINRENVNILSFLELMNYVPPSFFDDEKRDQIIKFIKEREISRSAITKYAGVFPDKAMRTLIESEVIYNVTQ